MSEKVGAVSFKRRPGSEGLFTRQLYSQATGTLIDAEVSISFSRSLMLALPVKTNLMNHNIGETVDRRGLCQDRSASERKEGGARESGKEAPQARDIACRRPDRIVGKATVGTKVNLRRTRGRLSTALREQPTTCIPCNGMRQGCSYLKWSSLNWTRIVFRHPHPWGVILLSGISVLVNIRPRLKEHFRCCFSPFHQNFLGAIANYKRETRSMGWPSPLQPLIVVNNIYTSSSSCFLKGCFHVPPSQR